MNKSFIVLVAFLIGTTTYAQKKKDLINEVAKLKAEATEIRSELNALEKAKEVNLENDLHKFSYAFGVVMTNNLKAAGFDSLPYNVVAVAIEDVMKEEEKITVEEAMGIVQSRFQEMQEAEAKEKSAEGELFLAENAKRPTVVTTESGLQYEILTEGKGVIPESTDHVSVHYKGMLIDGKVFDSSIDRGEPATLGVTGVIQGWQEALQLMPVGSKWKVYVPQDLGYGPRGAGNGMIPPYAALIFEMELLSIEGQ
ncbi:FKBP-type peptidyl-prolyl cis-trans isomerase [Kriegella aquimaris]|uniref:Peptidyl-prolyl cis-trans isomerase n=1 Tax=Kriegella aquimaris TaxID=192904 RepID=A0A1G9QLG7_9FLAO|nr:FKBP-type peptidyl-prolyl cis-trans isomerase [Kriegella aquimaris]SDM11740.1 FKBP-type peptidyl-prolyl cis-trans isomerase FklB [Kriegella aquimaris]